MSQRGALFPWRTIGGEEASAYYPAGTAQYHINADIAYAIGKYVAASGRPVAAARRRRRGRVRDRPPVGRPRRLHPGPRRGLLHQRGHRARRVHGAGQQQRLHEPDGPRPPAVRGGAGRRAGGRRARRLRPRWPSRIGAPARGDRRVAPRRRPDADPARRRPRGPRAGRLVPRPGAVAVRVHAPVRLPAAAALPPAGDLPPPGAQAVRRRARPGAAVEPVHDRGEEAELRLLRPAHDRGLVAVAVHPERRRGRARLRRRGVPLLHADGAHGPRRRQRQRRPRRPRGGDGGLVGVAGVRVRRPARRRRVDRVRAPAARGLEPARVPDAGDRDDARGHDHPPRGPLRAAGGRRAPHPPLRPARDGGRGVAGHDRAGPGAAGRDLRPRRRDHRHRRAPLPRVDAAVRR